MNNPTPREATLARAFHTPTRTAMIVAIVGDKSPVYLRDRGFRREIDGRHFVEEHLDVRFLSRQEEKRFNRCAAAPRDWADIHVAEGDDALNEIRTIISQIVNPTIKEALSALLH